MADAVSTDRVASGSIRKSFSLRDGRTITVRFERWVRDQQAFARFEDLRAQIDRDINQTRRWFELAG